MRVVVEVGAWEHECCGPSYERDSVVELTCLDLSETGGSSNRYRQSHHDLPARRPTIRVRGRLADIHLQHPDGSLEAIRRLPSGRALRGFDEEDDGHLEHVCTGEEVARDSDLYLLTILS